VDGRDKPGHDTLKSAPMYDIKWIREHPDDFDRGLTRRGITRRGLQPLSQYLISLDERRRAMIRVSEGFQARRRAASDQIHQAMAKKDTAAAEALKAEVAECKTSITTLEGEQKAVEEELKKALAEIPNLPLDDVPDGADASKNVELKGHTFGAKRDFKKEGFTAKQHFELGEALGMMDFELAAKLSGARFVVLLKGMARMERALGQLFLDVHTSEKHGYTEVSPPLLVRDEVMFGTAQLPKFSEDQFKAVRKLTKGEGNDALIRLRNEDHSFNPQEETSAYFETLEVLGGGKKEVFTEAGWARFQELQQAGEWWLIPTAEVPLTNLVRESIVDEDKLPMRLTACTPCFRAEAGAAGKDTRGMIRQHQFTKVELVSIVTPEKSKEEHERMLACAEEVLKKLDLHYRVVTLCTGDMGFAAQKTYDIEVWLPGQNMYREISSCSNCGEFQARRMHPPGKPSEGTRYRGRDGKIKGFVHTLNGSGVAVGRALIAVMENYQDENGAIVVPDALRPYMGGITKIERS
jgi:seryl-tRNA synthetase